MFTEKEFLYRWRQTDFSNYNEIDIREDFIRDLLYILGYSKNTINNIIREQTLDISEPFQRIGRKRVQIDYVPTIRLKSFWILEAKPGNEFKMDIGDMLQAYLYATHPEIQVPYIVLCNGWELQIYDVNERENWNKPFFTINHENCNKKFEELRSILSADKMLGFQRKKLLKQVGDTFEVEFDMKRFSEFKSRFNKLGIDLEKQIKKNEKELWRNAYRKAEKEEMRKIKMADDKELIKLMDMLGYASGKYKNEYYDRIVSANPDERTRLIRLLQQYYLGRPHSIFKINCMLVLHNVVEDNIKVEKSNFVKEPNEFLCDVVKRNLSYFNESEMQNALAHMDKLCCKASALIIKNGFMDLFHKLKIERIKIMPAEEHIINKPTVAKLMVPLIVMYAELLWRLYAYKRSVNEMWKFNWTLIKLIEEMEKHGEVKAYPDEDSDLLWYEHYSDTYDLLYTLTLSHIKKNASLYKGIDEKLVEYIESSNEEAIALMPKPKPLTESDFEIEPSIIQEIYVTALEAYKLVNNFS